MARGVDRIEAVMDGLRWLVDHWPWLVGVAVVIGGLLAGGADLYLHFALWTQIVIAVGVTIIVISVGSSVLAKFYKPSSAELQTEVHKLTIRGIDLGRASTEGGSVWDRWTDDMTKFFAQHGSAIQQTALHIALFGGNADQRSRVTTSLGQLGDIGIRLNKSQGR